MKIKLTTFIATVIFIQCHDADINNNLYTLDKNNYLKATTVFIASVEDIDIPLTKTIYFVKKNKCTTGSHSNIKTDKGVVYKFANCSLNLHCKKIVNGSVLIRNDGKRVLFSNDGLTVNISKRKFTLEYIYKSGTMEFKNYNIHKLIKISNLNVKVNINNGKHYLDIKSLNYTRKDEPIREKSSLSVKSDILDNKSINVKFNNVNRFRTLDFTGNNSSLKALVNTSSMVDKILVNNIELLKRSILLYTLKASILQ